MRRSRQWGAAYNILDSHVARRMAPFRKIISVAMLAGLALLLSRFAEHAKSGLVKALLLMPVVGIVWILSSNDDWPEDEGSLLDKMAGRFALLYGLGASLFLVVIGFIGLSFGRHDWVASLGFALPFGIAGVIAILLITWRRSR